MTTVKKGATDQTFYFKLVDSATGTPETALTITNIDATYTRSLAAAVKNDLTALAAVTTAHTDNKGIEVDATNAPGLYRIDFPDAAFASGADKVILSVTCSGVDPAMMFVKLIDNEVVDVYTRIGAPTGASIASDIVMLDDFIDTEIADIQARLPAALVSGRIDASVGAMAANVITAAATAADFTTEVTTGLSTLDAAGVRTAVGLASANLDSQLAAIDDFLDTEVAAIKAKTDNLPSDPADASDVAASFATISTKIDTIDDFLDTEIAAIKAKTDNLPTDPADQSLVIAATDAIYARIGAPAGASVSADVAAVKEDAAAILVDTGTTLDARIPAALVGGRMDASVGAMAANVMTAAAAAADLTTELQTGLATTAGVTTQYDALAAALVVIDDFLDTEIAAIKAKTDNLPASPAATGAEMALTSAAVDAVLDEVVEGSTTMRQMLRLFASVLVGKASGLATTTAVYRDIGDTKARITATVDADGNRTAVTRDAT